MMALDMPQDTAHKAPKKRRNRPKNMTLTPEARKALAALEKRGGPGSASREASAAIIERADREVPGWREE
jgi:hypothetical protein